MLAETLRSSWLMIVSNILRPGFRVTRAFWCHLIKGDLEGPEFGS